MEKYISIRNTYLFSEAIQRPYNYLKLIENKLLKAENYLLTQENVKIIISTLSFALRKEKIKFLLDKKDKYSKCGINEARTTPDKYKSIQIFCNETIIKYTKDKENFKLFLKVLLNILGHEIVHRLEFSSIKNKKLLDKLFPDVEKIQDDNIYLANKQEIMAFAWQIIEEFKGLGYDEKSIENIMKNYNLHQTKFVDIPRAYIIYRAHFINNKKILNRLHKYMYEYLRG